MDDASTMRKRKWWHFQQHPLSDVVYVEILRRLPQYITYNFSKCSECEVSLIRLNHDSDTELLCACICTLGHLALDALAEILIFVLNYLSIAFDTAVESVEIYHPHNARVLDV